MNSKIRMILIDLDGTLLHGVNFISQENCEMLKRVQDAGIMTVISTGRTPFESEFALDAVGANGYFIAMNGLSVYENYSEKKFLHRDYMKAETAEAVLKILDSEGIFYQVYAGDRAYCTTAAEAQIHTSGMDRKYIDFHKELHTVVDHLPSYLKGVGLDAIKIFISLGDPQKLARIRKEIDGIADITTLSSGAHYLEVIPTGADKRKAAQLLREHLGFKKEEIMAIGDSENDFGMLTDAGIAVAMGNACDKLKKIAHYVAPSNFDNGVAAAINDLIFNEL